LSFAKKLCILPLIGDSQFLEFLEKKLQQPQLGCNTKTMKISLQEKVELFILTAPEKIIIFSFSALKYTLPKNANARYWKF